MLLHRGLHLLHHLREFGRLHLVGLGEHDLVGDRRLVQQVEHLLVGLEDAMAGIDQHEGTGEARPAAQISLQHRLPGFYIRLRGLGIAIARHVHQDQRLVHIEEIELARAPRRVGGPRQTIDAGQRIDERGLADVGAAGKGNLHSPGRRQLLEFRNTLHETGRAAKQAAARVDHVWRDALAQLAAFFLRKGRLLRMLPKKSTATPWRFMMSVCCRIESVLLQAQ